MGVLPTAPQEHPSPGLCWPQPWKLTVASAQPAAPARRLPPGAQTHRGARGPESGCRGRPGCHRRQRHHPHCSAQSGGRPSSSWREADPRVDSSVSAGRSRGACRSGGQMGRVDRWWAMWGVGGMGQGPRTQECGWDRRQERVVGLGHLPLTQSRAHLQARVDDQGGAVQLHGQGQEPRGGPVQRQRERVAGKVLGQQQTATAHTQAPHLAIEGHHVPGSGHHSVVWEEASPGQVRRVSSARWPGGPAPRGTPGCPGPLRPVSS